jgi:glycosyltransferase involved in cell wall biosynthesis
LDSIFSQTYQNFELIVIDGGSTDGSLEIIRKYESDSRFHLLYQKSKGLPAGRNEGISETHGEIVAFLDADDMWCPTFLEKIVYLCQKYPDAGLYATAFMTSFGDHVREPRLVEIPRAPWDGIIPSYFRSSALACIYPFMPCCVAIPKKTFDIVGFFNPNLRWGEDSEMWGRIALSCPIAYTSEIGAVYFAVANNKMTDNPHVVPIHPFKEYLLTLPEDEQKRIQMRDDVALYLQKENLAVAFNNLQALDKELARRNLQEVWDPAFRVQKFGLVLLSYLPSLLISWGIPVCSRLEDYMYRVKKKL